MPTINVNDAYILDETGAEVDKATGLFTKNENATTGEKQMARLNIAAGGSNPNLLDNAYFVGGGSQLGDGVFPINQRGQSSYTAAGNNGIDRWGGSYCNIVLNASGLTITSTGYTNNLYQFVPYKVWDGLVGETVTLSFDVEAITGSWAIAAYNSAVGTISTTGITSVSFVVPSVADGNKFIGLAGQSGNVITLKAVKLELGTVSTLANDPPPDFGEELRKCQRYLYIPTFPWYAWTGTVAMATSATDFNWVINTPVPMRQGVIPTIGITNSVYINGTAVSNLAIGNYPVGNLVKISGTSAGMTNGQLYPVNTSANNVSVILSAEL